MSDVATAEAEILYEVRDHVAYVTLNRPKSLNAITHGMDDSLARIWDEIDADPEIWVVLLSASGERAFSAGADISGGVSTRDKRLAIGGGLTGVGGPLRILKKPLIAAVQGYVLGAGFELAMCADIIVAADTAKFSLPEIKVGIIGEAGVVHRAVRQLPYRVAMSLILTGERMPAEQALHYGLVNEVVTADALTEAAEAWARKLTSASPLAQQAAKHAVNARLGHPLEVAVATKFDVIEEYASSHDVVEGQAAFVGKRLPEWTGR
ncbi:crotonase/enoyl-CoA hydratase family protein [Leifsonia kafniensis]|uniref:Crotonase/enoyl-CoA hydratase family protein n=1 Tax=Leifsonia kafniensis TaxID=475957 RepID=A0ABP7KUG5_9MICO